MGVEYRSKADLVTEHLRRAIQDGHIGPGARVVLDRVATDLGVSKVPVREAVTRLTGEGLLELKPNIGPVVPSFTADDVQETALLRVAVEAVALEGALPRHDQASLDRAEQLLAQMADEIEDFPELNVRFHCSLITPAPYPYMRQTVENLLRRAQRFSTVHRVPGYRHDAHQEHQQLFGAVARGDLAGALELNERHIKSAAEQLTQRLGLLSAPE